MNSFLETIKKFGYISESVEIDILKNINTENKKKGHYLIKAGQDIGSITEFTNIVDLIFHGTTKVQDPKVFRESTAPFRWGIWAYPRVDYE